MAVPMSNLVAIVKAIYWMTTKSGNQNSGRRSRRHWSRGDDWMITGINCKEQHSMVCPLYVFQVPTNCEKFPINMEHGWSNTWSSQHTYLIATMTYALFMFVMSSKWLICYFYPQWFLTCPTSFPMLTHFSIQILIQPICHNSIIHSLDPVRTCYFSTFISPNSTLFPWTLPLSLH